MRETTTDIRGVTLSITRYYSLAIAVAVVSGVSAFFFPPFAYLSGAVVGLVALQRGFQDSLTVAVGAALLIGLVTLLEPPRVDIVFPLLLVLWFPNSVCAWVLGGTRSQGAALLAVGIFATLWVVGMHLLTGNVVLWWRHWLERHVGIVAGATVEGFVEEGSLPFINGIVTVFFGISLMLTLLFARRWHMVLHRTETFRTEFQALTLPRTLALPVIGLAVLVVLGVVPGEGTLWGDLLMVAIMMYLFQGLALLYALTAAAGISTLWVTPVYVGFFILPLLLIQGLAIIGVAGSVADFRPFSRTRR